MRKIKSIVELEEAIRLLEIKQVYEVYLLKEQLKTTAENLKPANLIKSVIREFTSTPSIKENLLGTTLSIAAGYLSKKVIIGSTHNPLKQILGSLLQIVVTRTVAKNTDGIKSTAMKLIQHFLNKKHTSS